MKVVSSGLDANIEGIVVDGDSTEMVSRFEEIEPDAPVDLMSVSDWDEASSDSKRASVREI